MLTNLLVNVMVAYVTNTIEAPYSLPDNPHAIAIQERIVVTEVLSFEFDFQGIKRVSNHERIVLDITETKVHRDVWEVIGSVQSFVAQRTEVVQAADPFLQLPGDPFQVTHPQQAPPPSAGVPPTEGFTRLRTIPSRRHPPETQPPIQP